MNHQNQLYEKLIFIFLDISIIYLSLFLSFNIRKLILPKIINNLPYFNQNFYYYLTLFWIPLIYIFFYSYHGLYNKTRTFWEDAREYFKANLIAFILILTIVTLSKESHNISRIIMVLFLLLNISLSLIMRFILKILFYNNGIFRRNVIIIGAGETGKLLHDTLTQEKYLGYKVLGFIDKDNTKKGKNYNNTPILGNIEELKKLNNNKLLDKVFIAIPSLKSDDLMDLYKEIYRYFKEVVIIPPVKTISLMNTDVSYIFNNDLLLLGLKNNSNYKINSIIKAVIDYVISIILLPAFTLILIIISILIKIESKGPVFYKQNRYSLSGKKITVYKFRSMYVDADKKLKDLLNKNEELKKEWELNYKLKNDPRVTKIGKILRKTSLDELPQIINVIKGEMSLVGPRPIIHEELEKYYKDYKEYFINTKAGITGLWQVSGRSDTSYEYRIRTDLWYILNWSIWLDLVIIFKTFITIIKGKGAY